MDRLSSLLNVREAAVFRQLAERIRSRSDNRAAGLSTGARDLVTPLERELKAALRLAPARYLYTIAGSPPRK